MYSNPPLNKVHLGLGGGSMLQVANRTHTQMMSYLIKTPDGKTVMIDGGNVKRDGDAKHLYELLSQNGKHVDKWFITHAHSDHFGALLWLLENLQPFDIKIDELYFNFPPLEWFKVADGGDGYDRLVQFYTALENNSINCITMQKGDVIDCGGMSVEVLNNCDNYQNYVEINDASIVLIAHFPERDVLFLADIETPGGIDLIKACGKEKLRCDIVQLAHHGQNGVKKDFYEIVKPKICLYNAPDWLWNNDAGDGFDTGKWKTIETRSWMKELGAQASFPIAYGDYLFD